MAPWVRGTCLEYRLILPPSWKLLAKMNDKRKAGTSPGNIDTASGQHAGVMLSPSKKSKLSPDSVVMITPLPNQLASSLDGLSGEEVCMEDQTFCTPVAE